MSAQDDPARPGQERWVTMMLCDACGCHWPAGVDGEGCADCPKRGTIRETTLVPASLLTQAEEELETADLELNIYKAEAEQAGAKLAQAEEERDAQAALAVRLAGMEQEAVARAETAEAQLARAEGVIRRLDKLTYAKGWDWRSAKRKIRREAEDYFNPQPGEEGDADAPAQSGSQEHVTEGPSTKQHGRSLMFKPEKEGHGRGYDSRPDTYEHIEVVRGLLLGVVRDLLTRAHVHDASKLAEPERSMFDEFTPKLRDSTYGSGEYEGFREAMGEALEHHYAENRHHPEHFEDGIYGMNLIDLIEMLCDWLAATARHTDGDIYRSIEVNAERFGYGQEIRRLLLNTVPALQPEKEGEDG